MLAVVTRDHPGIAASISGALWRQGVALRQAHLFSAKRYGLALDFFHLAPSDGDTPEELDHVPDAVRDAIVERKYTSDEDEGTLPDIAENITLEPTASGNYHLRAETAEDIGGLIYFLACKAYRCLRGNIYALAAHTTATHAWVSVYLGLPEGMSLEEARAIVAEW
ncbi:MAG: hypothetical protein GY953_47715 [bacterium]|nr:hypothetical protein [bacterium]